MRPWRREAHPDLLPWLAAGRLDPDDVRDVKDHLARCKECSDVAASIASMSQSLRAAASEHIGVEDLVAWEEGNVQGDATRSARIEIHLSACAACREDLSELGGMGAADSATGTGRELSLFARITSPMWLAAAAAVLVIVAMLPIARSRWFTSEPGSVVLLPASRSSDAPPIIDGSKPWRIECVLPYSARSSEYRIRLERADGTPLRRFAGTYKAGNDSRVRFSLDPIPEQGLFRLVLEPEAGLPGTSYAYSLRVKR